MNSTYSYDTICQYLQQQRVTSLLPVYNNAGKHDDSHIGFNKIGIIPFVCASHPLYYFMKPVASHQELSPPELQICKGTRMFFDGNMWSDIKDEKSLIELENKGYLLEPMLVTALREGNEELGLKLANIKHIFEMGEYTFTSASSGKNKKMWMFAAEVIDTENFLSQTEIANTTSARQWANASIFTAIGRKDHKPIVADIDARLTKQLTA